MHDAHAGDPTNEDLPSAHAVHAAAATSEYVPAPQAIQPAAAVSLEPRYWPLVHEAHTGLPPNEDEPSAHGAQDADPVELEKVPARQAMQPAAAVSLVPRYWPFTQSEQIGLPSNEVVPSAHPAHEADPGESEYVPAPQAIQPAAAASPAPRY